MINTVRNVSLFPLFEDFPNLYVKQTVLSLFRTLLETIMDLRSESVVVLKTDNLDGIEGILTRLSYSNAKIFSYDDTSAYNNFEIMQDNNVKFEESFVLIMADRFSVVLAWAPTDTKGFFNACITMSSAVVGEVYEVIKINSEFAPVEKHVSKLQLDRRGNVIFDAILNKLLLKVEDYQRDLICANNEIQEYNILEEKDVRNILRNYSHELRNPVGMLGVYGKILNSHIEKIKNGQSDISSLESAQRASEVIINAIETIESTLSEMSNYSREIKLNIKKESLKDVISNVVDFASPSFKQKEVSIIFDAKCDVEVNIDRHKIYQIMLNLLKNALEATDPYKSVKVVLDKVDNNACITIKDEGHGVSPEILPKIFRPYFTTKENSSGIGLAFSKDIIEKHGGELDLLTNSENGCEFIIKLH
ncbi:MAG: HAMP domain-containing sensor histidine kinase [Candidatus Gastranaerophilales bacterium]|nr:HAMP domain-containing sensor histidine kinase [Candidatus Gastranaerophilales bacterium]